MAKREYDHPEEVTLAAEWQAAYEEEKKNGAGNPVVEFLSYVCFVSFSRGWGRQLKYPRRVELVGERGSPKKYQIKDGELPKKLQKYVESELGTDDYDGVVESLRRVGKR